MANTEKLQATLSSTAQLEGRVQNQTTLVGTAAVPYSVGGGSGSGESGVFTITAILNTDMSPSTPDKTYEETVAAFESGQAINLRMMFDFTEDGEPDGVLTPFMVGVSFHDSSLILPPGFMFVTFSGENILGFNFAPDGMIYVQGA